MLIRAHLHLFVSVLLRARVLMFKSMLLLTTGYYVQEICEVRMCIAACMYYSIENVKTEQVVVTRSLTFERYQRAP